MNDENIDFTDIPATDKEFWANAEVFYPHKKNEIKFEIDDDLAAWLKQFGTNSSVAVNNLLRAYYVNFKQFQNLP